jgi:hypothetical protein
MNLHSQWQEEVYHGLKSCLNSSFPKRCHCCGKIYASLEDFIESTQPLGVSGLREFENADGKAIVGLFRNCTCQSTLVALCENRRDSSPEGKARRRQFDLLLGRFVERGLDKEEAREALRLLLHGQDAPLLSLNHGITLPLVRQWFDLDAS